MPKRKSAFNVIDALIIIVIAAVVALVYLIFFRGSASVEEERENEKVRIRYVMQVNDLDGEFADNVKENERVIDADAQIAVGTVIAVDHENSVYVGEDIVNGKQTLTPRDGYINLYITVECDAENSKDGYKLNGVGIYVGKRVSMMLPDLYCSGSCISIEEVR